MLYQTVLFLGSVSGTAGTNVAGYTTAGGSSLSELSGPTALFIDLTGIMYIYDSLNYRVQKWKIGEPLGLTVAGGRGSGTSLDKIVSGNGLYVDNQARVYVSENTNHRVTRWDDATIGFIVIIT